MGGTPVPLSVRLHGNIEKSYQGNYDIAGTRGQSLSLEAFRVDRVPLPNITIRCQAHIPDVGEVRAVHVGKWVGSPGKDLIAFSASLEGPDAHKYVLRYMAHLAGTGDTGHYIGGDMCGDTGQPKRLEGLKMWLEELPTVHSARETYVNWLEQLLQLHKTLNKRLALVEPNFKSADETLSEVHRKLAARLLECNVASTTSSAVSVVGELLLLSPVTAPVGAGLTAAGTAASIGTSVAQTFFYESDAIEAFKSVINNFTLSSKALQETFAEIEATKEHLIESFLIFRAALDADPLSDPTPPTPPNLPSSGPGAGGGPPGDVPREPNFKNALSKAAFKGLALHGVAKGEELAAAVTKGGEGALSAIGIKNANLRKFMGKALGRVFSRAFLVLSIAIDVNSIIETWTVDNETLKAAEKLRHDIAQSVDAFRDAVRQCQSMMEDLVGSDALRKRLRKLIKLQRPQRPPSGPKKACKLKALMESMVGVPFLLFASLQGDDHEDETKDEYRTELIPQADMVKLSEMATTAPVVDSVYEHYPNLKDLTDADHPTGEQPRQVMAGFLSFSQHCRFVEFGGLRVYNVTGSTIDRRVTSWVRYWRWWYMATRGCAKNQCYIDARYTDSHSQTGGLVGGHMEEEFRDKKDPWYILPICKEHNKARYYDRGGEFGGPMTTVGSAKAVEMPTL